MRRSMMLRSRENRTMSRWRVTLTRRGVSPLTLTMLVGAESREAAGGLAEAVVEGERGGRFEAERMRCVARVPGVPVDDEVYY